jgi:Putative mono-oxygenase ydhR
MPNVLGASHGLPNERRFPMITVITTFQLPKPITREEARSIFLSTAPKYQGVAGLFRKCYVLSQDGNTAGGIYLWNSRAEAEAIYTESWRAFVREKYGTDPSLTYFESPVVVDNVTHEILSDE